MPLSLKTMEVRIIGTSEVRGLEPCRSTVKKLRFRWASSLVSSWWRANSYKNNKWGRDHRMLQEWASFTQIRIFVQPANIYVFLRIVLPSVRNQRIRSPKPLSSVCGSKGFSNSCKQLQPVTDFQMRFQLTRIRVDRTLLWRIIALRISLESIMLDSLYSPGFVKSLEFLKKSRNFPNNFLDVEKVWKNGKKSWDLFFQSYNKCFVSEILFFVLFWSNLIQSRL